MKNKSIIFILLCSMFVSCGEDRRKEYAEKTQLDRWIETTMIENYYWYADMAKTNSINYFTNPADFLKTRRASQDNGYSYIENAGSINSSLLSYGMEYDSYLYNDTAYAVRVLYVKSDSPARQAGLTRGDWIIKRNSKYIIKSRIDSLSRGGDITVTRGEYKEEEEDGNKIITFTDKDTPIAINAARVPQDNPVHYAATYSTPSGKKVGYLVYSEFTQGTSGNEFVYDNLLRTQSNTFKSEGVTEFILDLRYNTGGSLASAQLLASILAPASKLEDTFCKLIYNNKQKSKNEDIPLSGAILSGGSNLNLSTLYVITGSSTAAMSDVLINCLKSHMKVILIGKSTKGNYTCTHPYTNEFDSRYILHLVDCMIHNADSYVPTTGHNPDYVLESEPTPAIVEPFGSPNEVYLIATLNLIESGKALNQ